MLLGDSIPSGAHMRHLLWLLMFLKMYASEAVNAALTALDEKYSECDRRKF